jgi:hypothetical protein
MGLLVPSLAFCLEHKQRLGFKLVTTLLDRATVSCLWKESRPFIWSHSYTA